jgi:acyl-CoA thioesterase-1
MNRLLAGLGVMLWVLLFGCDKKTDTTVVAPPAVPSAPSARILAFGDSLTAGKDLEDPDTQAYPAVLERRLRGRGHSVVVINAGQSGDTTFEGLARIPFSLQENPDLVILMMGSNDTFQGKSLVDIERNLNELVRTVKASGAEVLLCGMKTFPNLGRFYADGYDKIFPRVAQAQKATFVPFPLEGVAGVPEMNLGDGIHPNARGYERMVDHLIPFVEAALRQRLKGK